MTDSLLEMPGIALIDEDEEYCAKIRPVIIWREDEEFNLDCGRGASIQHRRMLGRERDQLLEDLDLKENTPDAVTAILKRCVKGWKNFTRRGKQIKYDEDLLHRLPDDVRFHLIQRIFQACPDMSIFGGGEAQSFIYYRRQMSIEAQTLLDKNTSLGVVDQDAFVTDMMQLCIKGWHRVLDWRGNEVEFDRQEIDFLPDRSRNEVAPLLRTTEVKTETELLKNSKAGGNASSPIQDSTAELAGKST